MLLCVNNNVKCHTCAVNPSTQSPQSRRPTRAEQNAVTGRRLLEALMELVAEKGYEATTAAEIGLRAGFSRAMVHARYGTKDVLLDELMRTEYEEKLVPDIEPDASGLQQVQAIVDRLDSLASEDERFLKGMFKLCFEAVRGSPSLTPRITAWLCNLEAAVGERLKTGQKDGSVRADVNIAVATRDMMITGTGIAFAWIVMPGTDLHNEYVRWQARIADEYGQISRQPSPNRRSKR